MRGIAGHGVVSNALTGHHYVAKFFCRGRQKHGLSEGVRAGNRRVSTLTQVVLHLLGHYHGGVAMAMGIICVHALRHAGINLGLQGVVLGQIRRTIHVVEASVQTVIPALQDLLAMLAVHQDRARVDIHQLSVVRIDRDARETDVFLLPRHAAVDKLGGTTLIYEQNVTVRVGEYLDLLVLDDVKQLGFHGFTFKSILTEPNFWVADINSSASEILFDFDNV
mmetsp:Transcript_5077/g.8608  ORF Transcript_5077/g.8608 Transcript_5077/m.8608 type:complete len:222 (-) Transcript_5077:470-1135(-)